MSEAHAKALAPKLLTAYKDLVANGTLEKDLLPTEASLVVGLMRLVKDEFLTEDNLKKAAAAPRQADWLNIVKVAAKAAQTYSGLTIDGIMAGKTIQWLQFAKRCHDKLKKNGFGTADHSNFRKDGKPEFRYYIEPEVIIKISNVNVPQLLEGAFAGWRRVAKVVTSRSSNPGDANVIVKVIAIDGSSNVLADAHVGPPRGNQQLELRFDIAETWATTKFLATASHEIGHLLGLSHIATIGHLMNPTLGDVSGPTVADGKRLINELHYDPTPEFDDLPEQTPDEFIPMWDLIDPNQPQ